MIDVPGEVITALVEARVAMRSELLAARERAAALDLEKTTLRERVAELETELAKARS